MNGVVSGFSSVVPSAFWSMPTPFWAPKDVVAELTVIDQLMSSPMLLGVKSSISSVYVPLTGLPFRLASG